MLTFIETKLFTSLVEQYLADDGYAALQQALVTRPVGAGWELVHSGGGGMVHGRPLGRAIWDGPA